MKANGATDRRVHAAELARLSDYSPASITNFARAGILKKTADGKFNLIASLEAIRTHEASRQQSGKRPDAVKLAKLRQLYLRRRIELIECEIAEARGLVHSRQECSASLGAILSGVWSEILALPNRAQSIRPEVSGLEELLVSLVNESADRLSRYHRENCAGEIGQTKTNPQHKGTNGHGHTVIHDDRTS